MTQQELAMEVTTGQLNSSLLLKSAKKHAFEAPTFTLHFLNLPTPVNRTVFAQVESDCAKRKQAHTLHKTTNCSFVPANKLHCLELFMLIAVN